MDKLQAIGLVALGGSLGAVLRYTLTGTVHRFVPYFAPQDKIADFLWTGTLFVNLLGCFCIGCLMSLVISREYLSQNQTLFLITGLLGSLTTFSTFGYETMDLLTRQNLPGLAFLNVATNLLFGFTAVWLGHQLVRYFIGQ